MNINSISPIDCRKSINPPHFVLQYTLSSELNFRQLIESNLFVKETQWVSKR